MAIIRRILRFINDHLIRRVFDSGDGDGSASTPPAPAPAQPSVPPSAPQRQWTLMIYMAGDNGLRFEMETGWTQILHEMTSAGYTDLAELRTEGSTDQVQALVQFDTVSENDRSYRIVVNGKRQAPTVHTIPEINTGDPGTLRDFIVWGQQTYPARRYAVVIWNHGGGWKEEDIYAGVRDVVTRSENRTPVLFKSTYARYGKAIEASDGDDAADAEKERWIAADDTSLDFLDNQELAQAFADAHAITGERVHLIGMDACLMAMVEVGYQIRAHADVLVASQEIEPMDGWPYTTILAELNARPQQSAQELGAAIVRLYGESYADRSDDVTQSAVALDRLDPLVDALRSFVDSVETNWRDEVVYRVLTQAHLYAPSFEDSDYRDLRDVLAQVQRRLDQAAARVEPTQGMKTVRASLEQALALFAEQSRSPVLANLVRGDRFVDPNTDSPWVHGLSVYLPKSNSTPSPAYRQLDFRRSRWHELAALILDQ